MIIKIAFKNLINTGIRLWINVVVTALSISIVLWTDAIYRGFTNHTVNAVTVSEAGAGHFISPGFDQDDPLTWLDKASKIPAEAVPLYRDKIIFPVRFRPATLYYKERKLMVNIKGIDHFQNALSVKVPPLSDFYQKTGTYPAALGKEMIKSMKCRKGDVFTITWKNSKGAFDAADFTVHTLMNTQNPRVESMSIWIDLEIFNKIMEENMTASFMVIRPGYYNTAAGILGNDTIRPEKISKPAKQARSPEVEPLQSWSLKSAFELTQWIRDLEEADRKNILFIYTLLVFLCCVGVFNSQITAVFKREKEIGTLMSLGLTNFKITLIFALEGIITALIAIAMVFPVGLPLFYWSVKKGINADYASGMGIPMPKSIKALYTVPDTINTFIIFFVILSIVSWLPVKKILKMKPAHLINKK
jgi:ABC-type lipoprotein release transport system permease subunit